MIPKAKVRGKLQWRVLFHGLKGGVIQLHINKDRISFNKKILMKTNEELELGVLVLKKRAEQVLHLKDRQFPEVARIAAYAIDATEVTEFVDKEKGSHE